MKKGTVINQGISDVIAGMGHTDMLVIADAGLPIPNETRRIDLALTAGIPGFIVTLRTVLAELQVQEALVAEDTGRTNPRLLAEIKEALGDARIKQITHQELKERCAAAKAVIRTGEFTPYANIILVAGVVF